MKVQYNLIEVYIWVIKTQYKRKHNQIRSRWLYWIWCKGSNIRNLIQGLQYLWEKIKIEKRGKTSKIWTGGRKVLCKKWKTWLENTQYEERLKIRWRTVQLLCISLEKECQWADVCDPSWVQGLGSIPAFVVAWNICKKDIENINIQ